MKEIIFKPFVSKLDENHRLLKFNVIFLTKIFEIGHSETGWVEIFFEKLTTFCALAPPLRLVSAHTFRKRIKRKLDNPTFSMSAVVQKNLVI